MNDTTYDKKLENTSKGVGIITDKSAMLKQSLEDFGEELDKELTQLSNNEANTKIVQEKLEALIASLDDLNPTKDTEGLDKIDKEFDKIDAQSNYEYISSGTLKKDASTVLDTLQNKALDKDSKIGIIEEIADSYANKEEQKTKNTNKKGFGECLSDFFKSIVHCIKKGFNHESTHKFKESAKQLGQSIKNIFKPNSKEPMHTR